MKVFKDLKIAVAARDKAEFLKRLEQNLPTGWKRDKEAESRIPGFDKEEHAYFVCDKKGKRQAALVALVPREGVGLYISNIVPWDLGQLTHEQYNLILDEFATACIAPVATKMNLTVAKSSDEESIDDLVSPDTAAKFRRSS